MPRGNRGSEVLLMQWLDVGTVESLVTQATEEKRYILEAEMKQVRGQLATSLEEEESLSSKADCL
ncbi:uncharacterized protein G2W53_027433 [Senna tora]|uniref:Uncharacterized protein n=1 Tax=Senna tora TaxID=362788 RepID=A0A834TH39_9FABA|nr:uncharacterized protein G2W53_027433 [Senna tora]